MTCTHHRFRTQTNHLAERGIKRTPQWKIRLQEKIREREKKVGGSFSLSQFSLNLKYKNDQQKENNYRKGAEIMKLFST